MYPKISFCQTIIFSRRYYFARISCCQNIVMPIFENWVLQNYQFSTICSQIDGPKSSQNNNLGHPQTQHVQSRGVMVPVEPSSPVIANRTCCKYQSGPRVMVPLEPSSFVSFGQLFYSAFGIFLEIHWVKLMLGTLTGGDGSSGTIVFEKWLGGAHEGWSWDAAKGY